MTLTKKDLIIFLEKNNFHTKKNVIIKKDTVKNWSKHDMGCLIALLTLQHGRSLKSSIENAESWMEHDLKTIINTWFKKDMEASF